EEVALAHIPPRQGGDLERQFDDGSRQGLPLQAVVEDGFESLAFADGLVKREPLAPRLTLDPGEELHLLYGAFSFDSPPDAYEKLTQRHPEYRPLGNRRMIGKALGNGTKS